MTNVAAHMLHRLMTSMEEAETRQERAAIWAGVIDIRTDDQPGVAPGFSADAAPGIYFNGWALYAVAATGTTAYRDRQSWSPRMIEVWSEIEQRRWDQQKLSLAMADEGQPVRRPRGRPAIGDARHIRFPDWVDRLIEWYAEDRGVKVPEAIRQLVVAGLYATQPDPIDQLSQMVAAGKVEVIDVFGPVGDQQ